MMVRPRPKDAQARRTSHGAWPMAGLLATRSTVNGDVIDMDRREHSESRISLATDRIR